jgi:hypothetical protein
MYSATERVLLACACLALACGGEESRRDSAQDGCFVGDVAKAAEFDVVYRTADGELKLAEDMAEVPLIQPPQGGKVLFLGVRARNLDGCGLTLATALVEPDGTVVSLERRPVTLEANAEGWMEPQRPSEASNYSNLPACPRADLARSIEGEVYELRVNITDSAGRKAERSLRIVPMCGEPGLLELCHCECSKDYRLGGGCAGSLPGGSMSRRVAP